MLKTGHANPPRADNSETRAEDISTNRVNNTTAIVKGKKFRAPRIWIIESVFLFSLVLIKLKQVCFHSRDVHNDKNNVH